jgi:hypothetical protein
MNVDFKKYLESSEKEEEENLLKTLSKVPSSHKKLLDGYKIKYIDKTTLDGESVGMKCGKKISISNSWNYGREFVTLHEIGHMVWEKVLSKKDKIDWKKLISETKEEQKIKTKSKSLNQSDEEIFCMAYASKYSKHPSVVFHNDRWLNFIEKFN